MTSLLLDLSSCPGCAGRPLPAADPCGHLRAHEGELATQDGAADLVRVLRLHGTLKWLGRCVCWAEKPEMRGAEVLARPRG